MVSEISRRGCHSEEARSDSRVAYLGASRMVPATFCVLDAFLAVRTVTVHDCEDHVSLKMLDEER